jgi:hypothetical protein
MSRRRRRTGKELRKRRIFLHVLLAGILVLPPRIPTILVPVLLVPHTSVLDSRLPLPPKKGHSTIVFILLLLFCR